MDEHLGWVGVFLFRGAGRRGGGAIGEDDDLVDAEDGEGAGELAGEVGFEVVGLGTGEKGVGLLMGGCVGLSGEVGEVGYLARMLPGRATERV